MLLRTRGYLSGMVGTVWVGTSGWAYRSWRGDFYPRGLKQREELTYIASRLGSLELNGSFYSLQRASSYRSWYDQTPRQFALSVKGSRYITHLLQLREPGPALANFLASGPLELRHKLGPMLWQLPERTAFDPDRLRPFLLALPRTTKAAAELAKQHDERVKEPALEPHGARPVRHVLEVRGKGFDDPAFPALLRDLDVGLVVSDGAGRWPLLDSVTSDVVYVRLHGPDAGHLYAGSYSDADLSWWAARIGEWSADGRDVYAYFNNDGHGHAVRNALRLRELVGA